MITGKKLDPIQAGLCGSLAGGLAAAVTTPLDVVKTRIMLSTSTSTQPSLGIIASATQIYKREGPRAFFKGIVPRVTWISIGGSIFLGVYEAASNVLNG
jgi:solute carrier family 25 S-adenosylmethionine transporter 26